VIAWRLADTAPLQPEGWRCAASEGLSRWAAGLALLLLILLPLATEFGADGIASDPVSERTYRRVVAAWGIITGVLVVVDVQVIITAGR
jgi:hypothetical protein